ncbi:MAG: type II toxin-antitoxin system Phd/YefM family antitoxin [bacterium]|nr:type II toxin-antitoxin system Phd/YefM family antitoxin [bacterium]
MGIATDILKANHIGIRDLKKHLSTKLLDDLLVITDRGNPVSVNLPYSDVLELMDMLDELTDSETLKTVNQGRKAIEEGEKGIPVSNLFNKIRETHK